jgi:hypothetical protein
MKPRILIICAAVLATLNPASATLRLTDPVVEWRHASLDERLTVANLLAFVAGQEWGTTDEEFFERCLDNVADEPRLGDKRIRDVANACVLTHSYFLSDPE